MKILDLMEDAGTRKNILLFAEKIRQNCQPYLQENSDAINNYAMLRGIQSIDPYLYKDIRLAGRRMMNMNGYLHDFFNKKFTEYYGAPFRDAMFASGDPDDAGGYGETYIVFPKGKYEYIWSEDAADLFISSSRIMNKLGLRYIETKQWKELLSPGSELYERLDSLAASYKKTDLKEAIVYGQEIMIRAKGYYAIRHEEMLDPILKREVQVILYK